MTLLAYRICSTEDGETRTNCLFIVGSEYHDDHDGAICIYRLDGLLFIAQTIR